MFPFVFFSSFFVVFFFSFPTHGLSWVTEGSAPARTGHRRIGDGRTGGNGGKSREVCCRRT